MISSGVQGQVWCGSDEIPFCIGASLVSCWVVLNVPHSCLRDQAVCDCVPTGQAGNTFGYFPSWIGCFES